MDKEQKTSKERAIEVRHESRLYLYFISTSGRALFVDLTNQNFHRPHHPLNLELDATYSSLNSPTPRLWYWLGDNYTSLLKNTLYGEMSFLHSNILVDLFYSSNSGVA